MAYYFASDLHLGLCYRNQPPLEREQVFVRWLDAIADDCTKLFLVGDVFDFWYEWRKVVPRGFTRVLGRLAEMVDRGVEVHFMAGNHDLWACDYFRDEIGMIVHTEPYIFTAANGMTLMVDHGHALGKHDWKGRAMLNVFNSRTARWLFSNLFHPNWAMALGHSWSHSSRHSRQGVSHAFGGERERLVAFARDYLSAGHSIDLFVFGHLHTPVIYDLPPTHAKVVILGEWITNPVYARLDEHPGAEMELLQLDLK